MARNRDKSKQQNAAKKGKGSVGLNRKSGEEYLEKNARRSEIFVCESGLQIEEVIQGEGSNPGLNSIVTIHQRIKLVDGTIVRDTFSQLKPDTYPLNEGIDGLIEGLQTMKAGGRSVFTIPSELAWGKRGAGNKIGPYAVLIADVRLISFS